MVFCGKPSRGCALCRAKKKKCDETRPSCSLCERTGVLCPGYRDQLSLKFRDESVRVEQKVQIFYRSRKHSIDEDNDRPPLSPTLQRRSSNRNSFRHRDILLLAHIFPLSLEEQATAFFFNNYVFTEAWGHHCYFAYLPIAPNQIDTNKALSGVIVSIGIAGISLTRGDRNIMTNAHKVYSLTLCHTKAALVDSHQIHDYQTMITVLLLSLYETVTCSVPQSMRSWTSHLIGATALLSLRGQGFLYDETNLQIFLYLRLQIIIDCLQRRVQIPSLIVQLSKHIRDIQGEKVRPENMLDEIATQLCHLRAMIRTRVMEKETILQVALSIDESLVYWTSGLPADYSYTTVYDFDSPQDVFFGCYHVYPEPVITSVWNHYRCLRILTHEVILDSIYCSDSTSLHKEQMLSSSRLLNKLTSDICASIPPYLGYRTDRKATAGIGILLIWPLYVAAAVRYASNSTREWIISQCDKIGETMGIQLATSLARILSTNPDITVWSRITSENERHSAIQVGIDEEW